MWRPQMRSSVEAETKFFALIFFPQPRRRPRAYRMFHVKQAGERPAQAVNHAAARRLAATYRADSAAGVTPAMRDA